MNFTPVLDELLICQIASTHHENTEFDHCFSPVAMGDCVIDLTKSLNGGVADAFFPPPPATPRTGVLRTPAVLGVRPLRASHPSRGRTLPDQSARAVTILPAVIAGSS